MNSWIIIAVILIIFFMWPQLATYIHDCVCPCPCGADAAKNGYMRRPLERFSTYCCRFKFSPHQYPIIPVPKDLFNTWYRLA